jgi:hypothetical protein
MNYYFYTLLSLIYGIIALFIMVKHNSYRLCRIIRYRMTNLVLRVLMNLKLQLRQLKISMINKLSTINFQSFSFGNEGLYLLARLN